MGDKVEKTKHNVKLEDVPGDGMAQRAANAMTAREERRQRIMSGDYSKPKKKSKPKKEDKDD